MGRCYFGEGSLANGALGSLAGIRLIRVGKF